MAKKLEEYSDKVIGRPIRLNKVRLEIKKQNYAELLLCGDWHYGYPTCLVDKLMDNLDYCLKKRVYVLLMGDLFEASTKNSVGDVYGQVKTPQEQLEDILEMLHPLAKKGLIIGLHRGNHEMRIYKDTGIDITKIVARELDVPYLMDACWHLFSVGDKTYKVYTLHGTSAARFNYTKMKALEDVARNVAPAAHMTAMGHVHEMMVWAEQYQWVDMKKKTIIEPKRFLALSGHYLGYDKSYAQMKGMSLGKVGSPKIKLYADKYDIHGSE